MSIFAAEPDPDPVNPPTSNPPARHQPTRRRMTLNLSVDEYRTLERIAANEHTSIHEAIRRSANTRWRIATALNPRLALLDHPNVPESDLDLPGYLALHQPQRPDRNGDPQPEVVTRLELGL